MNLVRVSGRALLPAFLLVQVWSAAATPPRAAAQTAPYPPGAVVALAGTTHLWFADDQGTLHWGGDTRALAGRTVDWGTRVNLTLDQVKGLSRGDPWLSAGLVKVGDPIYFVKWESNESQPRLLHIQSIADVELFGINANNYGAMVMDQAPWEAKYGFAVASLVKAELESATGASGTSATSTGPTTSTAPAASAPLGAVLVADTFDNPDLGVFPKVSSIPTSYSRGYEGGEYVYRKTDLQAHDLAALTTTGRYADAVLAIDARQAIDDPSDNANLTCRRQGEGNGYGYTANVSANSGRFSVTRRDAGPAGAVSTDLVARQASAAIKRGTASNHIELRCVGSTITLTVNGVQVAQVQDTTYPDAGLWWVQPATTAGSSMETHFDNFSLREP